MAKDNFKTAKQAIREATTPTSANFSEDQEKPAKKEKKASKAEKHINIILNDDQLTFLKAFCKIRGESYSETIAAMIERTQRENSELVALVERAKAAL